ncbi:MAG: DUF5032 domain-containing protein [Tannerellaceae bacterium]|nr:DUF5032 domain-containing protein [Tannerellaceae bacterium]
MKHYFVLLIITVFTLQACSKSEKPETTIPNKLTKITSYKNDNLQTTATISYNTDGEIAILNINGNEYRYSYEDGLIFMLNVNGEYVDLKYSLDNYNQIAKKEERARNEYSGDIYVKNEYTYGYRRYYLNAATLKTFTPMKEGGYEERTFDALDNYEVSDENTTKYTYGVDQEVVYTYGNTLQPENFPFRVLNSFYPYELDFFLPINYWFGKMNKNLPEKAQWLNVLPTTTTLSEYTFEYSYMGDYITSVTIKENSTVAGQNVYKYNFEYNYQVNK